MIREYIYFMDDNPNGTSGMTEEEVVRCKDCKHYKPFDKSKKFDCPQGLYAVFENDYCSHGERREE